MSKNLIIAKKKMNRIEYVLTNAIAASVILFLLAIVTIIVASKIGYNNLRATDWYNEFKNQLFIYFSLIKYTLIPWLFLIATLDYFMRKKKFSSIHQDYNSIKYPFVTVIILAILLIIFTAFFSTYSMLGILITGDQKGFRHDLINATYFLVVVLLPFLVINLVLDKEYISLSEELLAKNPTDDVLFAKIHVAFWVMPFSFRDEPSSPWTVSDDSSPFGDSSSDSNQNSDH